MFFEGQLKFSDELLITSYELRMVERMVNRVLDRIVVLN